MKNIRLKNELIQIINEKENISNVGVRDVKMVKSRRYLLSLFIDENIIKKGNTQEYILLIKLILEFSIDISLLLGTDLETESLLKSRYHFMVFWCKQVVKKSNLSYSEKNRLLACIMNKKYTENSNPKFYKFINAITERMNINYIFRYSLIQLNTIFKLYEINPTLFEYPIQMERINKTDNIIECFFKEYKIPEMFLQNFFGLNDSEEEWLLHLIKGERMHTANNLPLPLTKKAAHIFRNFSKSEVTNFQKYSLGRGVSIEQGFVLASFLSFGVSKEFSYDAIKSIRNLKHSQFWIATLSRFYKKGLESEDLPLVMDYINDQVFNLKNNINWKHKKVNNLLRDSEQWHNDTDLLHHPKEEENIVFPKSSISNYSIEYTSLNNSIESYSIEQIKSSNELYDEGRQLRHCVYSYSSYCESNSCQIFSLSIIDQKNKSRPLLTIEVTGSNICQVRGKHNREPIDYELEIINKWAINKGLACCF
jgi:hypothetical protein